MHVKSRVRPGEHALRRLDIHEFPAHEQTQHRPSNDPGLYQTQHLFTEAGEYETVLSFRKGEEGEVHTVEFTFNIRDRATLEIPRRKGGGGS